MTCNKDFDLVSFLNNELADEEMSQINRHIAECSDCLRELADIRTILDSLAEAPEIEPSRDFTNKVLESVRNAPRAGEAIAESRPSGIALVDVLKYYFKFSPPWAFSTALHAIIFVGLSFIFVSQTSGRPVPIDGVSHWVTIRLAGPPEPLPAPKPVDVTITAKRIDRQAVLEKLNKGDDKMAGRVAKLADQRVLRELRAEYKGAGTEAAVASGLKWLSRAQDPNGQWMPSKFNGRDEYASAMTGLATLCFTAQGNWHINGEYSGTVDKAIHYLISTQQPDGELRTPGSSQNLYNHGIAAYALLEDYLLASNSRRDSLQPDMILLENALIKAITFIIQAQSANGGWGYEARSRAPDTSITVWQIRVLRLASVLDIPGTEEALYKSRQWLNYVTDDDGLVGYQARQDYPNKPDTLTAAGLTAYLMIDSLPSMNACQDDIKKRLDNMATKQSAHLLAKKSGRESDLYYWYWSSQSMMSVSEHNQYNTELKNALLKGQSQQGSWQSEDKWSIYGGELYTTSIALLTLQPGR